VISLNNIFYFVFQLIIMLLLAPLVGGIIKKVKALSQKRKGSPLLQNYFDIFKLLRKETVVSETSSWIYRIAPYITFGSTLCAAMFIPVAVGSTGFAGDMLLTVYLLAMGRFFMALAALDTGSTFGGMGSSREMMISSLFEPALLVALFSVALVNKSTSLAGMETAAFRSSIMLLHPVYILSFLSIMVILFAETARIPVDDPSTHLELTMVHEAMLLEYSGRQLALMEMGAWLKQLFLITVVVNIFIPSGITGMASGTVAAVLVSLALYFVKVIVMSFLIAVVEVFTVKFRLFSVPNLAAFSFILAFLGFFQYFVLRS
jgi:formate hydrogenlyase subunit 4